MLGRFFRRLFGSSKRRAHAEVAAQAAARLSPPPPPPAAPAAPSHVSATPAPVQPVHAEPAPVQPVQAEPAPVQPVHAAPEPVAADPASEPAPEATPESGSLRLIYPDGRVEEVRPEGEVGERIAYLMDNLLPPDPETRRVSRTLKGQEKSPLTGTPGSVRLMFEDGHVEDLPADPEMQARIAYLVDNILHGETSREPGRRT